MGRASVPACAVEWFDAFLGGRWGSAQVEARREGDAAVIAEAELRIFNYEPKGYADYYIQVRPHQCPAQPLPACFGAGAASATPSTRSAQRSLTGGRCRPQRPWERNALPHTA